MVYSVDYQSLQDFSGLPIVRESCARGEFGLRVTKIPPLSPEILEILKNEQQEFDVMKSQEPASLGKISAIVPTIMTSFHQISQEVFKNLSHAFELPWEKYLGEMHEYMAGSKDRLCLLKSGNVAADERASLTIAVNTSSPNDATVIYGACLSVFSEGTTPVPDVSAIESLLAAGGVSLNSGDWLVYHVCPNDDVFYTRCAGALMTPLSSEEYKSRKRVKDFY